MDLLRINKHYRLEMMSSVPSTFTEALLQGNDERFRDHIYQLLCWQQTPTGEFPVLYKLSRV